MPTYTTGDGHPGVRPRVRVQREAGAPPRLRVRPQGRRPDEALRLVGHLLRHLQARVAARLVRRRQVARVLLHARHGRLADAGRQRRAARPRAGTIIRGAPTADNPVGGSTSVTPRSARTRSILTSSRCACRKRRLASSTSSTTTSPSSARYVHKQVDRAIEDTGSSTPDGNESYVIANPGEGLTALAFTNPNVALPKAVRDYDSVEFAVEKRLSNNWYLRAELPVEPSVRQLLGPDAVGRERPHQPERRPPVRLPGDDVPGRRQPRHSARCRPIGRTSSRRSSSTSSASARRLA